MNLQQLSAGILQKYSTASSNTKDKPSINTKNSIIGGVLGYTAATALSSSLKEPLIIYSAEIAGNIREELGKENIESIVNIADKFIDDKKLKEKGLNVIKVSKDMPLEEQQKLKSVVYEGRNFLGKFLYNKSLRNNSTFLATMADVVSFGLKGFSTSALYIPKSRALLFNKKGAGLEIFKELAIAAKKFPKLQAAKIPLYNGLKHLTLPIILIGVCSRNKNIPEGQQLNKKEKFDKFTNFVRNNAGKLSMAAFAPALLMNISNSARAANIARKYASKEIAQASYAQEGVNSARILLATLITGLSAVTGVKVKDWFQNRSDKKALTLKDSTVSK